MIYYMLRKKTKTNKCYVIVRIVIALFYENDVAADHEADVLGDALREVNERWSLAWH